MKVLSKYEYEILNYLKNNNGCNEEEIVTKYGENAPEVLKELLKEDHVSRDISNVSDSDKVYEYYGKFCHKGKWRIEKSGLLLLQNYEESSKEKLKEKWSSRRWSLAGLVITGAITFIAGIAVGYFVFIHGWNK
jgi:hypothetical protein